MGIFFSYPGNAIDGKGIGKVSPAPLQPDWGPPLRGGWGGGLGNHMGRGSVVAKRVPRGGRGGRVTHLYLIDSRLPMRADTKNIKEPYGWIRLMLPIHYWLYNKTDKFK